jgi:hypothetical protein
MADKASKEERDAAFRLVEDDVRQGISAIGFAPNEAAQESADADRGTSAFGWGPPFDGSESARDEPRDVTVVPWTFVCNHVGGVDEAIEDAGLFHGMFPTGREVTIRGVTFVDRSSGEPQFYRYVDWADALTQLGCTVSQRVLLGEDAYVEGLHTLHDQETQS